MTPIVTEKSVVLRSGQTISLEIIPFHEWRIGIAPLWHMQGVEQNIPKFLNGHGQMRFCGREPNDRILLFPIVACLNGTRIGWTSVYNISDTSLRVRGIYVQAEQRAMGVGRALVDFACSIWPGEFYRTFMYARESNIARYIKWGFKPYPDFALRTFEGGKYSDDQTVLLMFKDRLINTALAAESKTDAG